MHSQHERFKVQDVKEQMPPKDVPVLAFVENQDDLTRRYWMMASFNGRRWVFSAPEHISSEVQDRIDRRLSQIHFPLGDQVTHWVSLPARASEGYQSVREIGILPIPTARYNRELKAVEIFGKPSPYTEAYPYTLDEQHYKATTEALDSLAHVGGKRWAYSATFLRQLAESIVAGMEDCAILPGE